MSELYLRLAGVAFLFLGGGWIWAGFLVDEPIIWIAGGLTAAAGAGLLSIAPKLSAKGDDRVE